MQPSPQPPPSILKRILIAVTVLTFIGLGVILLLGMVIYACIRPDRPFRDLQGVVLSELSQTPRSVVAIRAPSPLVSLVRFGFWFADDLQEGARLAIRTVRGGQVGVHQLRHPIPPAETMRMLNRVDEVMTENRWRLRRIRQLHVAG